MYRTDGTDAQLVLAGEDIKPNTTYTFWVRALGAGYANGNFGKRAVCTT